MVEPDATDAPAPGALSPDAAEDSIALADGAASTPAAPHPNAPHPAPTDAHGMGGVATRDPGDEPSATSGATTTGARLVVKRNGAETDEIFPVSSPATIGRFDPAVGPIDVDLGPLPEGAYVSRKHARLTQENGVWTVADLGSSNGTFVLKDGDFARAESAELADGDEFALGNARFVLRLS